MRLLLFVGSKLEKGFEKTTIFDVFLIIDNLYEIM